MRVVIFSDVHGNLTALEAVLIHIEGQSPDVIVFAGDLCLFGPRPAACIDLLRQRKILSLYGNADEWVIEPPVPPDDIEEKARQHRQNLYDISNWTQAQLSKADLDWLKGLPFQQRISPTSNPQDDLLIVHANPKDVNQPIFPTTAAQQKIFGEVKQKQSDDDLAPLLQDLDTQFIAFGHLHVPNVRQWRSITLANISSVSLAGDGNPDAKYGLFSWDKAAGWSVEHQFVPYDIQKELDAMAIAKPPGWEIYNGRLQRAGK